jgi:hypothetical protein
VSLQALSIPLRSANGRLLQAEADLSDILRNIGHYHLKRNKRNNITCAILKERAELSPLTRTGEHYRQQLESGRMMSALRGTPGAIGAVIL